MDPSLSFHKHCNYVTDRIDKQNNMLKALVGSSWGQDNETLTADIQCIGESITRYAAPTQVTRALRRYRQRRMHLLGRQPGLTRWPVLTSSPGVPHTESQGPLRHALCAIPNCELSGGGPRLSFHNTSRAKT